MIKGNMQSDGLNVIIDPTPLRKDEVRGYGGNWKRGLGIELSEEELEGLLRGHKLGYIGGGVAIRWGDRVEQRNFMIVESPLKGAIYLREVIPENKICLDNL